MSENQIRIIRKPELKKIVGLSDPTIWRLEKSGKFPKRLQLGGNSVGWADVDVQNWILSKRTVMSGV